MVLKNVHLHIGGSFTTSATWGAPSQILKLCLFGLLWWLRGLKRLPAMRETWV